MKSAVIIGAGQMGRAAASLLNLNNIRLLAFGDNDPGKWDDDSVPVVSVEAAVRMMLDEIIIGVLGSDRASELAAQVRTLGYCGRVRFIAELYHDFDIRSRCIRKLAERIDAQKIPGAVAELGVYRGDTAWQLNEAMPGRQLYLFDTFEGFDEADVAAEKMRSLSGAQTGRFSDTSEELVLGRMPHPEKCILRRGYFPETAEGLENERYAFVSMDADLYLPTLAGLEYFFPRLSAGGVIVLHDFDNSQFAGVGKAVEEYEAQNGPLRSVPLGDLHGSLVIIK